MIRFRLGRPEVDGGWEKLISTSLSGVCRSVFAWTENTGVLDLAFGTHATLEVWQSGDLADITPYGPPVRLGSNPLGTTNSSGTVVVTHVAHGYATSDSVKVYGAATTNGIDAANLAGTFSITVINDDSYSFTAGASDTASSTGSGGGANVVVTPQSALPEGAIDGTGTIGYGTGAYGAGPYGQTPDTAVYYPRTWAFGAWGENLLANPRGGGIYQWTNNTANRAVAVDGAPTQVQHMLVAPMSGGYMCFALGCEQEADGVFNPLCIRHSSVRDLNGWSTTASGSTSREYILTGGGRIVAGAMCGPYLLVWTSDALFLGQFTGALIAPWAFDRVGKDCGLIGPNAVVVVGQVAYWVGLDNKFYRYAVGGEPEPIACPIWTTFNENIAPAQGEKVVASANAKFDEVRFEYPDAREGYENSRYIRLCIKGPDAGSWSMGELPRTAFLGEGVNPYPIGVTYEGTIYLHERGQSADGSSFAWYIETADQYLNVDTRMLVRGIWPDFKDQVGPVTVTLTSRETPQGDETTTTSLPMAPGDTKADLLAGGRLFRVKFSGESSPTACRIGTPVFDLAPLGMY